MLKLIPLGVALCCSIIFPVSAQTSVETKLNQTVRGTVSDEYKKIIRRTPYTVEVCSEREVSGDKTADTLLGALIGGAIGNNVTKNLPDGGTAGAIIGGIIANQNSDASGGTKLICNKTTRYNESMETIYSHSTITFVINGIEHRLKFKK